jgi:hypothetical protein
MRLYKLYDTSNKFVWAMILCSVISLMTASAQEPFIPLSGQVMSRSSGKAGQKMTNVSEFDGSLTKTYPIAVPSGRGDATPELALNYSSNDGNGDCGVGWSLGLSYIERVGSRNGATDFSVLTSKFILHLNGSPFELIWNGVTYRTKQESFMKIEQLSGISWKVIDADGTQYLFNTAFRPGINPTALYS